MKSVHHFKIWHDTDTSLDWKRTTRLFQLSPQGLGTSMVESLAGYIARLANEHCIKTGRLFIDVLTPYLNKFYLNEISKRGGNGFYDSAHMINGNSVAAEQFSTMLNDLTGNTNLQQLTLLRFAKAIPQRGLLRNVRAWCPECYEEMKQSNSAIVYEPLIWSLRAVSVCRKHHRFLIELCPSCTRTNLLIDRRSSSGFCSHCNAWLGRANTEKMDRCDYEQYNKAKMVERLLASMQIPNKDGIVVSLNYIVAQENSNITGAARKLSVPKTTFWTWYKGRNLPQLEDVLRICNKYGIDIVDFYLGHFNDDHSPVIFAKRKKKINIKLTTRPLIEVKMLAKNLVMDSANGYMHVQAMADEIACNKKTLYNHFPALCKAQAMKWKQYLRKRKHNRLENIRREVDTMVDWALNRGEHPTISRLEQYMKKPAVFREAEVKKHFKKAITGDADYERINFGG